MSFLRRLLLIVLVWLVLVLLALQTASHFFLAPLLERQGKRLFQTPVEIEGAVVNILTGSVWMKVVQIKKVPGFETTNFFYVKRLLVDIDLFSLLANEFVVKKDQYQ